MDGEAAVETDDIGAAAGASRVRSRARLRTAKRAEGAGGRGGRAGRGEGKRASREGYRDRSLQLAQNFLRFLLSRNIFCCRESV